MDASNRTEWIKAGAECITRDGTWAKVMDVEADVAFVRTAAPGGPRDYIPTAYAPKWRGDWRQSLTKVPREAGK